MQQNQIEGLLKQKAKARVPALTKALAKVTQQLSTKDAFIADAKAKAERKVAAWESLQAQYQADLAIIAAGSYPGYNGKPFGATPTVSEGLV